MSGLGSFRQKHVVYLSIFDGKLAQKVDADTLGAIQRTNKKGNEVFEVFHDYVCGHLVSCAIRKNEAINAKEITIVVDNNGQFYQLSFPAESRQATDFATKANQLAYGHLYTFVPYSFEDKVKRDSQGRPKRMVGISIYACAPYANGQLDHNQKLIGAKDNGSPAYRAGFSDKELKIWKAEFQEWVELTIEKAIAMMEQGFSEGDAFVDDIPYLEVTAEAETKPEPPKSSVPAPQKRPVVGTQVEPPTKIKAEPAPPVQVEAEWEDDLPF